MPGLFLAFSKSVAPPASLETALQFFARQSGQRVTRQQFSNLTIAQVTVSRFGHSYYQHPDGISVWVYGALFSKQVVPGGGTNPLDAEHFAETICHLYLKFQDDFVHQVNGEFNILILDQRQQKLLIVNDRFAVRPWYWLETPAGIYFSPTLNPLIALLPGAPQLDREILVGFMAFNKMRLGNRTMIQDISILPAASLWKLDLVSGKMQQNTTWQFRYNDATSTEIYSPARVTEIVDCYRAAMNQRAETWQGARVGISLSGGLDSRTMIAALDKRLKPQISAHTYGLSDSDEVLLAVKVAETAGIKSYVYPLDAPDYPAYAEAILDSSDELDIFVQAAQLKFLREAEATIDVLMTGIDLDVTLGGIYLEPEIMAATSLDEIFNLIKRKNVVFAEKDLQAVLTPSLWSQSAGSTYQMASDLLKALPQENPAASYDLFINQFSMRRIIMLRYAQNRTFLETASPMYDYDFIDLICALPLNQRAKHASFIPFLEALSQPLSEITYQRTLLPANAPRHFWRESEEIEHQREQLYLKIWRETNGKVNIPYRRYYTNFDEWLRMDPAWIDLTDRLLSSPDARLYQMQIANPAYVAEMIRLHRSGERSHRQRLIILMSLELFLRRHFN